MDEIHENQLGEVLTYQFEPVLNKNTGSSGAEAIPRASHFISQRRPTLGSKIAAINCDIKRY